MATFAPPRTRFTSVTTPSASMLDFGSIPPERPCCPLEMVEPEEAHVADMKETGRRTDQPSRQSRAELHADRDQHVDGATDHVQGSTRLSGCRDPSWHVAADADDGGLSVPRSPRPQLMTSTGDEVWRRAGPGHRYGIAINAPPCPHTVRWQPDLRAPSSDVARETHQVSNGGTHWGRGVPRATSRATDELDPTHNPDHSGPAPVNRSGRKARGR